MKKHSRIISLTFVVLAFALTAHAQYTEDVLYVFDGTHGSGPNFLIADPAGNIYGTAQAGGNPANCAPFGCGVVFKLSNSSGNWVETVIHAFTGGTDGSFPVNLALDAQGDIFGVAELGGSRGSGVVFKMTPNAGGWGFKVLHSFPASAADGAYPDFLTLDAAGNVYGSASGDTNASHCPASGIGCGLIFKLTPTQSGPWKEAVLHRFSGAPSDGNAPNSLAFDNSGNLLGLAGAGGAACPNNINNGCGTVFQLSPTSSGPWTETLLHTFNGKDGSAPFSFVLDPSGNMFGSTFEGGMPGCNTGTCGVVFSLSPSSGGWTESTIHKFNGTGDGNFPFSIAIDSTGNLYTANGFGGTNNAGTVDRFSPGTWTETILWDFPFYTNGETPSALAFDSSGNLFGAAFAGGDNASGGDGVFFQLIPTATSMR